MALTFAVACVAPVQAQLPDAARFGRAMELGDLSSAAKWLDEGLPPDFESDTLGSGLMIAAAEGNIALMQLFVERGANIDYISRIGEQAIALAAWHGRQEAVEWLLDHGAALNPRDKSWGALHYAAFAGRARIVDLLIARGAALDSRAPNLATPLMMAVREGNEAIVRTLVEAGADARAESDRGENALGWAMRYKRLRIAELVAPPEEVAAAVVETPVTAPAAMPASVPAPPDVAELLAKLRQAEAKGRPTQALRRQFMAAVDAHRRSADTRRVQAAPSALVISAKRGKPGAERAELVPAGATPALQSISADAGAADILRALQAAQDAGQPTEALRQRFREKVEQIRRQSAQ